MKRHYKLLGLLSLCLLSAGWALSVYSIPLEILPTISEVEQSFKQEKQLTTVSQTLTKKGNITNFSSGDEYWESFGMAYRMPRDEDALLAAWIKKHINELPTLFVFELSRRTYPTNPKEALKWFAVARLRMTYDGKRCIELPRGGGITYNLQSLYKEVVMYGQAHQTEYSNDLEAAVAWDKKQNLQTSPMWICAKSLKAFKFQGNEPLPVSATEFMVPKSGWSALRTQNYQETLANLAKDKIEARTK